MQRDGQNAINERIDTSIEMLKELEQIDSKMIQTIFEYNKMGREELNKEARAVL